MLERLSAVGAVAAGGFGVACANEIAVGDGTGVGDGGSVCAAEAAAAIEPTDGDDADVEDGGSAWGEGAAVIELTVGDGAGVGDNGPATDGDDPIMMSTVVARSGIVKAIGKYLRRFVTCNFCSALLHEMPGRC